MRKAEGVFYRETMLTEMNFAKSVLEAPSRARVDVGRLADDTRKQNWQHDKELLERPLLVFECLILANDTNKNHCWYGCLGYCLTQGIELILTTS